MKLVTFEVKTALGRFQRVGSLSQDKVLDLNAAYAALLAARGKAQPQRLADVMLPSNMRAFIEMGETALEAAREVQGNILVVGLNDAELVFKLSDVSLKTPLPEANSFRDFFAFEQHVAVGFKKRGEEIPEAWYQMPVYYKGNARSLIGPDDEIIWPRYTRIMDYELELGCVIGKEGRNIPVEKAHEYILGYTIINDFSARDIQKKEMAIRLGPAKAKDFGTSIGPWIVTRDEIDAKNLRMIAHINGKQYSEGNSKDMHFTFEQMIAHLSQDETIYPGDILGSGTVGSGCGLEHGYWLQPKDEIILAIEGLGELRNIVGQQEAS